jgi:hypothetical protein
MNLLPKSNPDLLGYDIAGKNIPALNVGGDYYDFIYLDDERLAIGLGDVSGKGLPASLLMANLQATLRGQTLATGSPKTCLDRSNQLLFQSTSPEKFATLFYAILDTQNHQIHYSNAGQDNPYLCSSRSETKRLKSGGIPHWDSGCLFIGSKGMILSDYNKHALLPENEFTGFQRPAPTIPRVRGHHEEWLQAVANLGAFFSH